MDEKALLRALFRPLGIIGVYARTALYSAVQDALSNYIIRLREPGVEVLRLPAVMSRSQIEKSGYLRSFPQLLGTVCVLHGTESTISAAVDAYETGKSSWTGSLSPSDLVLSPAACYPIYPMVAARGHLPNDGLQFDIEADCFRHEPSPHLDRLQTFRMREFVRIGSSDDIAAFRDRWLAKAHSIASDLVLPYSIDVATDPFFGRVGQVMAISQRQQTLKYELSIPIRKGESPTACMSFNNHRDYFGRVWSIALRNGDVAHTSCVAFGVDRLTMALFATHGIEVTRWPKATLQALML